MDLFIILGAIVVVGVGVYQWTNWGERRREYPLYQAHPAPAEARPAGDRRHFARLWRRYRRDYQTYCLPQTPKKGKMLSLGEYLRVRELEETAQADSPLRAGAVSVDSSSGSGG
jgi:hypothetical protein